MKRGVLAGMTGLALMTGSAVAVGAHPFTPGEGAFSWDSYEALKSVDLTGEVITIFGPWIGPDKRVMESVIGYFATSRTPGMPFADGGIRTRTGVPEQK